MVMDEGTSALSTLDEQQIQHKLRAVCEHKTTIEIAHRLSAVIMGHEIFVLDHGRIIARGNQKHLVKLHGTYEQMWKLQVGESESRTYNDKDAQQLENVL